MTIDNASFKILHNLRKEENNKSVMVTDFRHRWITGNFTVNITSQ